MSDEKRQAAQAPIPECRDFVSLQEIVQAARERLSQDLWDHLSGGADSEMTLRRNRLAFDSLALR
ncbi:MAG: alpha-hydroxy-acid oxidizing protein, partial [Burkholderiales bacterium]